MRIEQWLGEDNKLGVDIWKKKYQQNGETFDQWLDRISNEDESLKQLILERKFLFGGRILSSRGLHKQGRKITYSNCYVLAPPDDSIESIFEAASKLARTFSYGGGVGIDISNLAPRGAQVRNTAKETTGSVSFMELYNLVTGLIGQNGRRGALMLSIDCNHPDLEEFISVKNDLNSINKANISVRVDDSFMNAVVNEIPYHELVFVRKETGEEIKKIVNPRVIFDQLCKNNWDFAEPGILFWDRIKEWNLLSNNSEFEYAGVNPCAEEPLPAGGSCLLGSINLAEFVTDEGKFNVLEFKKAVTIAVRALNDVLDEGLPLHPLQEQRDSVMDWRQIGLGIFGLADMLILTNNRYGSEDAVDLCELIASIMIDTAMRTSANEAAALGAYPKCNISELLNNEFFMFNASHHTRTLVGMHGLRNSQLLTIAPTGSISTMLGVSGGIEPIFDTHYIRKTESLHDEDVYYTVFTPVVEKYMKKHNIDKVEDLPDIFATAKTITPMERLNMQSAFQKSIDASISSTVNVKEETTVEDVYELYTNAWKKGLKGLTIFRENCARLGILTTSQPKQDYIEEQPRIELDSIKPLNRKEIGNRLNGSTYVKEIACGKLYITINRDEHDNLVEVFIDSGKSGGCSANAECLGRYASACMRGGLKIEEIIDVTKGVKCSACTKVKGANVKHIDGLSCGDVVGRTIQEEYERYHGKLTNLLPVMDKHIKKIPVEKYKEKSICPECGCEVVFEGGCNTCKNCGYSKCD